MSEIEPRPTQTKVKHTILDKYFKRWGGIILSGLRRRNVNQAHFVYVDTNSSFGRYNGELEEAERGRQPSVVYGSPIIGLKVLDSLVEQAKEWGITLKTNAILIEEKKNVYEELKITLQQTDYYSRVKETKNLSQLGSYEIALVNDNPTLMASEIIKFTQAGLKFSFLFIDPIGPIGLPLKYYVAPLVSQPRHDAIIYMPYYDLHKKTRLATKTLLDEVETKLVENYNKMFDSTEWQEIVKKYRPDMVFEEWMKFPIGDVPNDFNPDDIRGMNLELELADFYKVRLQRVDQELFIKSIPLHFPDKDRTVYYLYLTTHDPTGALVMNEVLWGAEYQEYELRWRFREAKKQKGQISMLGIFRMDSPPEVARLRPDRQEIANDIFKSFEGHTVKLREIYRNHVDDQYFPGELQSALRLLKQEKRAHYNGSNFYNDLEIAFVKA